MSGDKITPFLFEGESILRTVTRLGAPWFVSADACRAIGIANPSQAVDALDDDEKGICSIYTPGGAQEMLIISESGLFTLILRSRDAMKKGTLSHRFRRWVTGEVLPALREQVPFGIQLTPVHQPEYVKVRMVTEARKTFGPRAAADLWFRLELPTVPSMHQELYLPARQSDMFPFWRPEESSIPPCS